MRRERDNARNGRQLRLSCVHISDFVMFLDPYVGKLRVSFVLTVASLRIDMVDAWLETRKTDIS